ncbi:MAG: GH116 family glycosyl-hydrolase [Planctomycetota bacterium]
MGEPDEPVYGQRTPLASGIPLGGMGAGSVEIMDTGRFRDWEIFNNYQWSGNRDEVPPEMWTEDAFFAVRTRREGGEPRVRLLHHEADPTRTVAPSHDNAYVYNYPFLRNVGGIRYRGRHPFARLEYEDDGLPLELTLEAFSPFVPHNAKDSALPLAFFAFRVRNTGDRPCETSLMFSMRNCTGYDREELTLQHRLVEGRGARFVAMGANGLDPAHRTAGSMAVGVLGDGASYVPAWTGGRGLTGFEVTNTPAFSQVFYPFRDRGELPGGDERWQRTVKRRHPDAEPGTLHAPEHRVGWCWRGALCRRFELEPGEEREVVFLLSWFFPNHYHFRYPDERLGHMYENWFSDAAEVAAYGAENFGRLRRESRRFADALYEGSLPDWLAASLNAQLTTFSKSFIWTADGDLAAWEGQSCCQILPAARTIWSSWVPLMFFPEVYSDMVRRMGAFDPESDAGAADSPLLALKWRRRRERSKQRTDRFGGWLEKRFKDYGYTREDFRSSRRGGRKSALWGGAAELLRDYRWTGDAEYLRELWPIVRDRLEAQIGADENGDGLPDGAISFVTYDHWFLPATNCYKCSLWLGELQAGARIAELLGEEEAADRMRETLRKGAESFEELLWNGEYYDLCWDPKRQTTDPGCMADQVSGQLFARILGLDSIHDEKRVRSALRAVHRHNLKEEEGLLNGTDPEGREDWRYFCRYSGRGDDESRGGQWVTPWTGTEYYVAAVMAAEGLTEEALDVARNVYERYVAAGMVYNHIECGEHYFRPLAAWALLPALQGLTYDRATGALTLAPPDEALAADTVFVLPGAWGRFEHEAGADRRTVSVEVESGRLPVRSLVLRGPWAEGRSASGAEVEIGGRTVEAESEVRDDGVTVRLPECKELGPGRGLRARLSLEAG